MNFYISLFKDSNIIDIEYYKLEDVPEGIIKHAIFSLNGQEFMAKDGNVGHPFTFTPAISLVVNCQTQEEIDKMWEKLSTDGKEEQCGWLSNKYGMSWQIVPMVLGQMIDDTDSRNQRRL